jgi:hypothetical protein
MELEEGNQFFPSTVKAENSVKGVEYVSPFDPSVREVGGQHLTGELEDTPERKMNVEMRADSYDWTGKSSEKQGFPREEEDILHTDPPLPKDVRTEVERVNSYDWNQVYTKEGNPEKGSALELVDGEEQSVITERINSSGYNRHGTIGVVGNPFRVVASLSHEPIGSHGSLPSQIEPDDQHNEGKLALPTDDNAPVFDVPQQEIIQRLPSLEDDPYYTYPNLFSKPSHHSHLP